MEDTSEHVTLQVRVGNKIYEAPVSSNAVTEILMKGDQSEVTKTISETNAPISEAMGVYDRNVEVLSVKPFQACQAEGNDVEVSYLFFFLY